MCTLLDKHWQDVVLATVQIKFHPFFLFITYRYRLPARVRFVAIQFGA